MNVNWTIIVGLLVGLGAALLTSLVGPWMIDGLNQRRKRSAARRMVIQELTRLRDLVWLAHEAKALPGWGERMGLQPPLPAWVEYHETLANDFQRKQDRETWELILTAYRRWDRMFLLYHRTANQYHPGEDDEWSELVTCVDAVITALVGAPQPTNRVTAGTA